MACIAILMSIYFFMKAEKKEIKILHILNVLLQASYIAFSDSRTGKLCLIAGIVTLMVIYVVMNLKKDMKKTGIVLLIFLVIAGSPTIIKNIYNVASTLVHTSETKPTNIGREGDIAGDISNRRFEIWESAFEIYKDNPAFGVSRKNIIAYAKANDPSLYIVNNDHMDFDSMHDLFFDILVSQGTVGVAIFYGFGLFLIVIFFKNAKKIMDKDGNVVLFMFPIIALILVSTLVMTELVYVDSPISTVFWMFLSYLMYYISSLKEGNAKDE